MPDDMQQVDENLTVVHSGGVPVKPDCYAIGFVVLWALMKNVEGGLSFA
jgi:hypothetical protein